MSLQLRVFVLGLSALTLSACVSPDAHHQVTAANERLQDQIDDLTDHQLALEQENERLRNEAERLGKNAVEADFLRQRKEELAKLIDQFRAGGARAMPGVKVLETSEGVAFQLQGEVLFDSGKAEVTKSGKEVLTQLVPTLLQHTRGLRIGGHTDSDPIRHSQWKTNLRLSAERAMSVVKFLAEQGMAEDRMHVSAFGQHRPAVPGDDKAAKKQNRRVEILMLEG